MFYRHKDTLILLIIAIISLILLAFFVLDLAAYDWSVFGATASVAYAAYAAPAVSNVTTITGPPTATPVIQTTEQIATTEDMSDQFNKFILSLVGTGGVAGGGVGTLWAKFRSKTAKIDNALRGQDFDNKDLLDHINNVFETAKKNKTMSLGDIIEMPAYRDKVLMNKTIAEAWAADFEEYNEWFTKRYTENPK